MTAVVSFRTANDPTAHEKFVRWCKANTRAFFVNFRSANDAMIHRVGCPHISNWSRDKDGDLASTEKVCGSDEDAVREAVRDRLRKPLGKCRTCFRPQGTRRRVGS